MKARKYSSPGLLLMVFIVGCTTASQPMLPVPESLATSSLMAVKRNRTGLGPRPLRFGEWQVNGFDRKGFPRRRKWSVGDNHATYSQGRGSAAYSFLLTPDARDEWECNCQFRKRERSAGLGAPGKAWEVPLTYEDSLECDLLRAGDEEPWKLEVTGSLWLGGEGYKGTLSQGSRSFFLKPSHRIVGLGRLPGPPLGYVFVSDGHEVASTELIRPGFVRINDDEAGDERDAIATAAAALLMQPTGF